jgi:excisionase family DNA binding protein
LAVEVLMLVDCARMLRIERSSTMKEFQEHQHQTSDGSLSKDFLSPQEASNFLGVSVNTLYEAIKQGTVPGVLRIGRRITINKQALIDASTAGVGSREV